MRKRFDAMSPVTVLPQIQAPLLILAHDRDDTVIPVGESRRLVAALRDRAGVQYTEFTMFKHLDPTKVKLAPAALAKELVKFLRFVYPLFRQSVDPCLEREHRPLTQAPLSA
jgi:dipeptidyl aminopeptidase/acylaminoacyl peptidase